MNALKEKLIGLIRAQGPISVAEYMRIALTDPEHGYYMTRDPLGRDFITAPEVSQIFGELIGLFFVHVWEDRGRPAKFHLVELGPGRGTLMADMLRAAKIRPGFGAAARIALIETSPALRAVQKRTLDGVAAVWMENLDAVPQDAPVFIVANEFLDALPAHQWIKSDTGWHQRMVAAADDTLTFVAAPDALPPDIIPPMLRAAPPDSVIEIGSQAIAVVRSTVMQIIRTRGVALFIDYGASESGLGDTFQSVKAHGYADPLAEPGSADLTFHVDFGQAARAARSEGAMVFGPVSQAAFLSALGINARAETLKRAAPERAAEIDAGVDRLIAPQHMGTLFKVMGLAAPGSPPLPGF